MHSPFVGWSLFMLCVCWSNLYFRQSGQFLHLDVIVFFLHFFLSHVRCVESAWDPCACLGFMSPAHSVLISWCSLICAMSLIHSSVSSTCLLRLPRLVSRVVIRLYGFFHFCVFFAGLFFSNFLADGRGVHQGGRGIAIGGSGILLLYY